MVVSLASLAAIPLPVLPLQILFLNLVTDVFPALALGVGEGDNQTMRGSPREPKEPIITAKGWLAITVYGLLITISVLGSLIVALWVLKMKEGQAVSVSFLTLAFGQIFHVFNMRDRGSGFLVNDITRNLYIWIAIGLCAFLILLAVYIPVIASVLGVVQPGREGWMLIIGMSLIPIIIGQIHKCLVGR